MLCAAYIIMHKCKAKKKKKRWWMRNYLVNRTYVFDDLRGFDGSFQNFTRMSRSDFELLLGLIGPAITRQETKFRHPIEPQRRLAITLRFIATGDSYGSLSYTFKVSKQLISKIIPEVCQELINVLKDYVKVSKINLITYLFINYLNEITNFYCESSYSNWETNSSRLEMCKTS